MFVRLMIIVAILIVSLLGVYEIKCHQPKLILNDQPYLYIQELGDCLPTNPSVFVISGQSPKLEISFQKEDLLKENCLSVGSYQGTITDVGKKESFVWYVMDTTPPNLTLKETSLTLIQGQTILEETLKSYADVDDLSTIHQIEVIHAIDFDSPGTYEITYYAYDASNNRSLPAVLTLTILKAPSSPIIQETISKPEVEIAQDYDAYFYSEESADAWAKEQCLSNPHLYKGYFLVGDTHLPNGDVVFVVYLYRK